MIRRFSSLLVLWALGPPSIASAQQSCERAAPQPDTAHYAILNYSREAGAMDVITAGDSVAVAIHVIDRSRPFRHQTTYRLGPNSEVRQLDRRGAGVVFRNADATERFSVESGMARWSSPGDSGQARVTGAAAYVPRNPISYDIALLVRAMLRRPGRSMPLLPAGTARLTIAADTTLLVAGTRRRLRLALVDGLPPFGSSVWLGDCDALVASQASRLFVTVRRGDEDVLPALRRIELAVAARRTVALERRLAPRASGAVVVRNGNVFDTERGVMRQRTTVVVRGDRIVAVGPADSIGTPRGATVIDATGRTVLPGMWDMHTHIGEPLGSGPADGLLRLAAGITTVRDLAADVDVAVLLRDRAQAGTFLSPRMILAGLLEGPGATAAPTEAVVATPAQALAWIARYDSLGYRQVKMYNLVRPELVPIIAAEAHRRGMRVSGHVPRGMTTRQAIAAGFDELNHGRYVILAFFPDSMWRASLLPRILARYDVSSQEMTDLVAMLRERGIVIDATLNLHEDRSRPLPDGTHATYGPMFAWLPPLMRRASLSVPSSPEEATEAQAVAANMRRVVKRLFDAGVTLVAGTDDNMAGLPYHGELEIYQRAGIPPANVLQIATIVPARVMGDEKDYGSIAQGKVADLVIVEGHPELDVRDLRRTEWVLRAGKPYRVADLYRAAGLTPTKAPGRARR